jgi:hypothetical protein
MTKPSFVDEEVYQLLKTDDVVRRLEATEQRLVHNLLEAAWSWEQTPDEIVAWEEMLERAAQVRIRLQRARRAAIGAAATGL